MLVELPQLVHETSSLLEVFYKKCILKNFSEFWGKQKRCHSEMFCQKGVFKNFAKFLEKHLCRSLVFNNVPAWKPETFFKKRLQHNWFPVKFVNSLRILFCRESPNRRFWNASAGVSLIKLQTRRPKDL